MRRPPSATFKGPSDSVWHRLKRFQISTRVKPVPVPLVVCVIMSSAQSATSTAKPIHVLIGKSKISGITGNIIEFSEGIHTNQFLFEEVSISQDESIGLMQSIIIFKSGPVP